jgi:hypothetical protein
VKWLIFLLLEISKPLEVNKKKLKDKNNKIKNKDKNKINHKHKFKLLMKKIGEKIYVIISMFTFLDFVLKI